MQLVPVCVSKNDRVISGYQTQFKRQLNTGPDIISELIRYHNIETYGEAVVQLHTVLTSALEESVLSASQTALNLGE
jgi:hypothetical protein